MTGPEFPPTDNKKTSGLHYYKGLMKNKWASLIKVALYLSLSYIALFVGVGECQGQGCSSWIYHGHCLNGAAYSCWSDSAGCPSCSWNDFRDFCWGQSPASVPDDIACACDTPVDPDTLTAGGSISCTMGGGGWCRGSASLYLSATDSLGHAVTFTGSGIPGFPCIANCSLPIPEGVGSYSWTASCAGGKTASGSGSYQVDATPPDIFPVLSSMPGLFGWYFAGPVSLTCSGSDTLSGLGSIVYGSQTANGDGIWVLDCTAYDIAGNAASAQETVRIDGTQPVIDHYLTGGTAGSNGWFSSGPVSLVCDATDATSGVAGVNYGVQTATGDGTTTLDCTAFDNAGNSSTASEDVRIDSQPPSGTLIYSGTSGPGGWYRSDVLISVISSDPTSGVASVVISVDGAAGTLVTGDGTHSVSAVIRDNAGNLTTLNGTVNIDTTIPTTAFTTGTGWLRGTAAIAGTASDATSDIAQTYVSTDGGAAWIPVGAGGNWSYNWDTTSTGDGMHVIQAYSIDLGGNSSPVISLIQYVDNTSPVLSLNPARLDLGYSMTIISSDAGSGLDYIRITISGNGILPRVINILAPSGSDVIFWDGRDGNGDRVPVGEYTVYVEALDTVGNRATAIGTWVLIQMVDVPSSTPWPTRTPSRSPTPSVTPTTTQTASRTAEKTPRPTNTRTETSVSTDLFATNTLATGTGTPIGGGLPAGGPNLDFLPYLVLLGIGLAATETGKAIQTIQKGNTSPTPVNVSIDEHGQVIESRVVMESKVIETRVPHMVEEKRNIIEKIQHKENVTINKLPTNAKKWDVNKPPVQENGISWVTRTVTEKVQRGWDVVRETVMVPVVKTVTVGKINSNILSKSLVYGGRAVSTIAIIGMLGSCGNLGCSGSTPAATVTFSKTNSPTQTLTLTITLTPSLTPGLIIYTVESGDNLYSIATKFNITYDDLIACNPQITNPNNIKIGDNINIPVNGHKCVPPTKTITPTRDKSSTPILAISIDPRFSSAERAQIQNAVSRVANAFNGVLGYDSAIEAFNTVFTNGLNFVYSDETPDYNGHKYWGLTANNTITIYSKSANVNATKYPRFLIHEIGHAFDNAIGGRLREKYNQRVDYWYEDDPMDDPMVGFASTGFQSDWIMRLDNSELEVVADMFLGWVYNKWDPNHPLRGQWMNWWMPRLLNGNYEPPDLNACP